VAKWSKRDHPGSRHGQAQKWPYGQGGSNFRLAENTRDLLSDFLFFIFQREKHTSRLLSNDHAQLVNSRKSV